MDYKGSRRAGAASLQGAACKRGAAGLGTREASDRFSAGGCPREWLIMESPKTPTTSERMAVTDAQKYNPRTVANGPLAGWERQVESRAYADDAEVESYELEDDPSFWKYFTDVRTVGRGAFAKVKEVKHKRTGECFAVKILEKHPSANCAEDLVREVKLLSQLRHPNICRLHAAYESPKNLYQVMEFADGGELMKRLGDEGPRFVYSEEMVRRLVRTITEAVDFLHASNIAHRDIKPENVLLSGGSEEPQVKLVDFGLARGFDTERQMRTVCGTHRYLAPEMISCERNERQGYDKAIDMWGVGLLVHIMLFGSNPFQRETEAKTHAAIMSGELDFPASNVTEGAKAFIRRLLCRSPDERMTSREALESEWLHEPEVQSAVDEEHSKERTQPLVVRAEGDKGGDTAVKRRLWEWNAERLMARAVKFTHRRLGAAAKEKLAVANAHAESSSRESPPIASSDTMLPNVLPSARSARAVAVVSTPLASMNAPASAPSDPTKMFARRRNTTGLLGFQSPIGLTRANRRSHDT